MADAVSMGAWMAVILSIGASPYVRVVFALGEAVGCLRGFWRRGVSSARHVLLGNAEGTY